MAIDYYAEARKIINALTAEGLFSEAKTLQEAIQSGSTATEILMGVRWHLQEIDRAKKTMNLDTKRKIRDLIAELTKVLS